jgi:hypothetical protein
MADCHTDVIRMAEAVNTCICILAWAPPHTMGCK